MSDIFHILSRKHAHLPLFQEAHRLIESTFTDGISLTDLEQLLQVPGSRLLVVTDVHDRIATMAMVHPLSRTNWLISYVVTHPASRRRGYCRSLLQYIMQGEIATRFTIEVATNNLPAISVYRSLGFVPVRAYERPDGEHFVMIRDSKN